MRAATLLGLLTAGLLVAPLASAQTLGLRKPPLPLLPHLMLPDSGTVVPPRVMPGPPTTPAPPSPADARAAAAMDPGMLILPNPATDPQIVWLRPERLVDPAMILPLPSVPTADRLVLPALPEQAPAPRRVPMQRRKP